MSSNLARKSRRKKQTRLAFDPINLTPETDDVPKSSLSPARVTFRPTNSLSVRTAAMSPVRGAATRVMRSATKPKKDGKIMFSSQPLSELSPGKSAQEIQRGISNKANSESDEPVITSSTRRGFQGSVRSSSFYNDLSNMPAGTPSFMSRNKQKGLLGSDGPTSSPNDPSLRMGAIHSSSSSSDSDSTDEETNLARAGKTNLIDRFNKVSDSRALNQKKTKFVEALPSEEDEEPILPTPRRTQPKTNPILSAGDEDSDDVFAPPLRSSQRQTRQVVSDEDDGIHTSTPQIKSSGRLASASTTSTSVSPIKINSDDDDDDEEEEEEDIALPTPSAKRKRCLTSDDELEPTRASSPTKRLKSRQNILEETLQPNETPKRSTKDKGKMQEIESSQRQTRQRVLKRHRTEKEKTIELLRRKRAGEKISELTDSESDEEQERGIYDSDSELEVLKEFDDEEEEAEEDRHIESVRQSIRGINRDEYDDDFVVADEDVPLGAPAYGLHDIPLEFTHQAHKPLKEHFKDCIEWMVQKKINPGFNSSDPLYRNSFSKMNDEVRGLANSKFMSSVWTSDFTSALSARPEFNEQATPPGEAFIHMHCDACNRSQPTKFILQFTGKPYNMDTLEEVEADEEDSDEEEVDSNGRVIASEGKTWYVGRFCKANAETAHSLIHWKYALNSWVLDQLANEKHLKSKRIAERDAWSTRRKNEYANDIVDGWERGKQLKELWRDFKGNLAAARDATQSRTKTHRE